MGAYVCVHLCVCVVLLTVLVLVVVVVVFILLSLRIRQKSHILRAGYQLLPSTNPFQIFFDEGKHLFSVFSQMACCTTAGRTWISCIHAHILLSLYTHIDGTKRNET